MNYTTTCTNMILMDEINQLFDIVYNFGTAEHRQIAQEITLIELISRESYRHGNISRRELIASKNICIVGLKKLIAEMFTNEN